MIDVETDIRLIPPQTDWQAVPVRFVFTGEEPPRIWTDEHEEHAE